MSNTNSNTSKELSVTGTITPKEYKKFHSYHSGKLIKWVVIGTYILFFSLLTYLLYQPGDIWDYEEMASLLLVNSFLSVCLSFLFFLYGKGILFIKASREYKSDQLIKQDISYTFSGDGITQKRGRSVSYIQWKEIVSVREQPSMFLIYLSKSKAIVLPKRFFDSREELEAFKELIEGNVLAKKRNV
ncbi:YcxB family protein [Bacillus sp. KH172YL63]|uniref:YcxB family protein n=1 Tax=Bacillus sp. KH172YL63 TaxID=2709784 RepID=UPI0013E4BE3B|nr:YcxB family protein [Bacillus sp. KH172YL63]BCB05222.1 hypothetical protein KH172YL63_33550 [Bacillus sp. KH172YL63]